MQVQHTRKRRGCLAASAHLKPKARTGATSRSAPLQRPRRPKPRQGLRWRTVTSARQSGDCVTTRQGARESAVGGRGVHAGTRPDHRYQPVFSVFNLAVRALWTFSCLSFEGCGKPWAEEVESRETLRKRPWSAGLAPICCSSWPHSCSVTPPRVVGACIWGWSQPGWHFCFN